MWLSPTLNQAGREDMHRLTRERSDSAVQRARSRALSVGALKSHDPTAARRDRWFSSETDSSETGSFSSSSLSSLPEDSAAVGRWQALPMAKGKKYKTPRAMATLVVTRPLILRTVATIDRSGRERASSAGSQSVVRAGTVVHVLQTQTLGDGTLRTLVSRQGGQAPLGWVSGGRADGSGSPSLVPRAAAFRQRAMERSRQTATTTAGRPDGGDGVPARAGEGDERDEAARRRARDLAACVAARARARARVARAAAGIRPREQPGAELEA